MAQPDDTDLDVGEVLADLFRTPARRPAPDRLRKGLSEDDDDAN